MSLGITIAKLRKEKALTQEALAKLLEVSNQAVSKWESGLCCPDIQLLPKIADIFETTIDALFGREQSRENPDLPWENDGTLRVVLYAGHQLLDGHPAAENMEFCYEGPALNIHSRLNVRCDNVQGSVTAGGNVTCDNVGDGVSAGGNVTCDNVGSGVSAGGNVTCDDVGGSVEARGNAACGDVGGSVSAGGDVTAGSVDGCVTAGGNVRCERIKGGVMSAGGGIYCGHME